MTSEILTFDKYLFYLLNHSLSNNFFDFLFPVITDKDFWIIPALVSIFFYYKKERKKAIFILFFSLFLVAITDPVCVRIMKPYFRRPRPCHPDVYVEGARYLLGRKTSFSFPSAHAMNIFAQAMLFSGFYPKKWFYFFGFAFIIGFSRIYVGVHYPLDVTFGAITGITLGFGLFVSAKVVSKNREILKTWYLQHWRHCLIIHSLQIVSIGEYLYEKEYKIYNVTHFSYNYFITGEGWWHL